MHEKDPLEEIRTRLAVLTEKVENWMKTTNDYRKSLCDKLDSMTIKLNDLPCKERRIMYQSVGLQIKMLWGFITLIVTAIVVDWVKGR